MMRLAAFILALAAISGSPAVAFDADTQRTWEHSWIIPQPGWLMRMDEDRAQEWLARLPGPRPIYLFFHGSAGFLPVTDMRRYGYLTRAGFNRHRARQFRPGGTANRPHRAIPACPS